MRHLLLTLSFGAALSAGAWLDGQHPFGVAALAVAALCALAMLAAESDSLLALAAGALSALAFTTLTARSPTLAGALCVALVFAPRAVRARSTRSTAFMISLAAGMGALGAMIVSRFASADLTTRVAAGAVAGILAGLPMLWTVDDPVTAKLFASARHLDPRESALVLKLAQLRRRIDDLDDPRLRSATLAAGWTALATAVTARLDAEPGTSRTPAARLLDERIARHADAIERACAAADTARVLASNLSDTALANVHAERDQLETEARALEEVSAPRTSNTPQTTDIAWSSGAD